MTIPWIKVEATLPHKPEVMRMAAQLDTSEHAVVGHLVAFWIWCDGNLVGHCPTFSGTVSGIDRVAGCSGFTQAMIDAGWLRHDGKQFEVVHFERHLAQSAKTRAFEAERKRRQRGDRDNVPESLGQRRDNVPKKPGPEERREDKNRGNTETQGLQGTAPPARVSFRRPTVADVAEYATSICADMDPQSFVDHYTSNGWRVGKASMKDWKAAVRNWAKRDLDGKARTDAAVRAGFTRQAQQDAQWDVFREVDEICAREDERERQRQLRILAGSEGGREVAGPDDHAAVLGQGPGPDDPF
jgi:hypothetical protein